MQNTPDVCVKTVIKDSAEWDVFVDSVCRSYGFVQKSCPLVYTLEGTLIGDGKEFVRHVRERYGRTVVVEKEQLRARQELNEEENNKRIKKKREGETLGEKIQNHLDKMQKRNIA